MCGDMYTQADLDKIQQAIIDLATGKRVVRLTIGSHATEFGVADLAHLRALQKEIAAELNVGASPACWRISASKGL